MSKRIKEYKKRSNAEIEAIINQICLLMIKGIVRRSEIFRYITEMDKFPLKKRKKLKWIYVGDVSERMVEIYIRRAKEAFMDVAKENRENVRALYIAQLEDLYQKALSKNNLQTANNIMKNKIYLQGLGGMNVASSFNIFNFDVALTEEEEVEYKKRINNLYGEDFKNE